MMLSDETPDPATKNRRLPFYFGHVSQNTVANFQWGRHHRAYLAYCQHNCSLSAHEMKAACGYKNISKFQRRRAAWYAGQPLIPKVFLDVIGVEMEMLQECVRLDAEEYDQALARLPLPQFYIVRIIPAVYIRHIFEDVNTLYDCYSIVQEAMDEELSFAAYIDWLQL